MKYKPVIFALLTLFLLLPTHHHFSQNQSAARTETNWGLHTTTFTTPHGQVRVYLPDDLSVGDAISGTVMAEPAGQTADERRKNGDELNGYVVELGDRKVTTSEKQFQWMVPADATTGLVQLILRNNGKREIGKTAVPVSQFSQAAEGWPTGTGQDFFLPHAAQAGRPIQISGRFDGKWNTTRLQIGGQEARILAESPRKIVGENPQERVGQIEIEVREGSRITRGKLHNLGVRLSSPKLNLIRGEQTTLMIEVTGLVGLEQNIPLVIENRTPQVVSLEGGDVLTVVIDPQKVSATDLYRLTLPLIGVSTGSFSIQASVQSEIPPPYSCCEREIRLKADAKGDSDGKTMIINNQTQRVISIRIKVPIQFDCQEEREKDCIGKFNASIQYEPRQYNKAMDNYDVKPETSSLRNSWSKAKCDGHSHSDTVTVLWEGTYPGTHAVKGTLKLELTTAKEKGQINHLLSLDVDASADKVTLKNARLDALK